jgi:hypothetical protein
LLAIGPFLHVFANTIGNFHRFFLSSLLANAAAECLIGRIVELPSLIAVHKAEKNFVEEEMFDRF